MKEFASRGKGRRMGGRQGGGGAASSGSGSSDDDNNNNNNHLESDNDLERRSDDSSGSPGPSSVSASSCSMALAEFAEFVPLRLDSRERHLLTVLEQTLNVSEYTDHVDVAATNTGYMGGGDYYGGGGFGRGGGATRGGIKTRRILDGIMEVCHIAVGLVTASGVSSLRGGISERQEGGEDENNSTSHGAAAIAPMAATACASKDPADNAKLFQDLFEVGRRNKVLNPASMRTTYGKLMYLLQDAQNPTVAKSLGFSLYKPLELVGPYLKRHGATDLLGDSRLECAVQYIADRDANGSKLDRSALEALVMGKQRVTAELAEAYGYTASSPAHPSEQEAKSGTGSSPRRLSPDDVRRVIESLADAVAYIESNVRPVQAMIRFLRENFDAQSPRTGYSLALSGGGGGGLGRSVLSAGAYNRYGSGGFYGTSAYSSGSNDGPTLSHSHPTQYMFVWQSLNLWAKVMRNMHRLWVCADDDLLTTTSTYHLCNTGQGLNRVQNCPSVRTVMSKLLSQTQKEAGAPWVGLSVVGRVKSAGLKQSLL